MYDYAEFGNSELQALTWPVIMPTNWDGGAVTISLETESTDATQGTINWGIIMRMIEVGGDMNRAQPANNIIETTNTGALKRNHGSGSVIPDGTGVLGFIQITNLAGSGWNVTSARLIAWQLNYNVT
jgi:hypothetical protein